MHVNFYTSSQRVFEILFTRCYSQTSGFKQAGGRVLLHAICSRSISFTNSLQLGGCWRFQVCSLQGKSWSVASHPPTRPMSIHTPTRYRWLSTHTLNVFPRPGWNLVQGCWGKPWRPKRGRREELQEIICLYKHAKPVANVGQSLISSRVQPVRTIASNVRNPPCLFFTRCAITSVLYYYYYYCLNLECPQSIWLSAWRDAPLGVISI